MIGLGMKRRGKQVDDPAPGSTIGGITKRTRRQRPTMTEEMKQQLLDEQKIDEDEQQEQEEEEQSNPEIVSESDDDNEPAGFDQAGVWHENAHKFDKHELKVTSVQAATSSELREARERLANQGIDINEKARCGRVREGIMCLQIIGKFVCRSVSLTST